MAFTAFILVWLFGTGVLVIGFTFSVVAAIHRKPGASFIRALNPKNRDLIAPSGEMARKRSMACLVAVWLIVPLLFATATIAMLRGEFPRKTGSKTSPTWRAPR